MEIVENIYFNYMWRGSSEYKGLHLVSYKKIAFPKEVGG
jgi:hypothetical protein